MQIRQRIFKPLLCKFYTFFRQNLQTFDISHAFLPLTVAKLSTFKNGPVSLAHPVSKPQIRKHLPAKRAGPFETATRNLINLGQPWDDLDQLD